jgi:pimeloyl-ACP methyl ester carboxylesterase
MRRAAVFCLILGVPTLARADEFRVIETHETVVNDLRRIITTVQSGDLAINRFVVERVLPAGQAPASLRPLILAPGLLNNQATYTLGYAKDGSDFENSIAANLARGGADVFLYSTRQALLAAGACDAGTDCSEAKKWGLQTHVRDLEFIRSQIAADHGSVKPVVGGYSFGGATGVAAINQHPNNYGGLIMIESNLGPNYTATTDYHTLCEGLRAQIAAGQLFNTDFVAGFELLWSLSRIDPNTYRPIFLGAVGAASLGPSLGPPLSFLPPGVKLAVTSPTGLVYGSEDLLGSIFTNAANSYTPLAEFADYACSLAGDRTLNDRLAAFTGPVLVIENEIGIGNEAQNTLNLLGRPSQDANCDWKTGADWQVSNIQGHCNLGLGHADLLALPQPDRATRLEQPILDWLANN